MEENNNQNNVTNNSTAGNGPSNALAIAGFVVSLCSLLINLAGIVGLVGTILSAVGLYKSKNLNGKGKGLAIAGIIIGAFSIIYGIYSIFAAASALSNLFDSLS